MFKTIVWATDGSPNADRALSYAKELAQHEKAQLVVAHVVQKFASSHSAGLDVYADEEKVTAKVEQVAKELADEGLNATARIVTDVGPMPAHEIADIAREVEADLIVVGTRGRTALGGLLLGSVTQRLLHVASCPVLAVPPAGVPQDEREPEATHAAA